MIKRIFFLVCLSFFFLNADAFSAVNYSFRPVEAPGLGLDLMLNNREQILGFRTENNRKILTLIEPDGTFTDIVDEPVSPTPQITGYSLNNSGAVAFKKGTLSFIKLPEQAAQQVVSDGVTQLNGGTLSNSFLHRLTDGNSLYFTADYIGGPGNPPYSRPALFAGGLGSLQVVLDTPPGGPGRAINVVNSLGAFTYSLHAENGSVQQFFLGTGSELISVGGALNGSQVTSLGFDVDLSTNGHFMFQATLGNGSNAIFVGDSQSSPITSAVPAATLGFTNATVTKSGRVLYQASTGNHTSIYAGPNAATDKVSFVHASTGEPLNETDSAILSVNDRGQILATAILSNGSSVLGVASPTCSQNCPNLSIGPLATDTGGDQAATYVAQPKYNFRRIPVLGSISLVQNKRTAVLAKIVTTNINPENFSGPITVRATLGSEPPQVKQVDLDYLANSDGVVPFFFETVDLGSTNLLIEVDPLGFVNQDTTDDTLPIPVTIYETPKLNLQYLAINSPEDCPENCYGDVLDGSASDLENFIQHIDDTNGLVQKIFPIRENGIISDFSEEAIEGFNDGVISPPSNAIRSKRVAEDKRKVVLNSRLTLSNFFDFRPIGIVPSDYFAKANYSSGALGEEDVRLIVRV